MKLKFIGDVHGKWELYRNIIDDPEGWEPTIQVGDMGIGFRPPQATDQLATFLRTHHNLHRFIRGNHDNPQMCKTFPGYVEDGAVFDYHGINTKVMCIGGAWSIDHMYRTEGVDWWADEELSQRELDKLLNWYEYTRPDVMVTHDCPLEVSKPMFVDTDLALGGSMQIKTRTGQAFDAMLSIHKPKLWVFGHWHVTKTYEMFDCEFQCLGELATKTYDLKDIADE